MNQNKQVCKANIIESSTELSQQINETVTKYPLLPNTTESFSASFNKNQLSIAKFNLLIHNAFTMAFNFNGSANS